MVTIIFFIADITLPHPIIASDDTPPSRTCGMGRGRGRARGITFPKVQAFFSKHLSIYN